MMPTPNDYSRVNLGGKADPSSYSQRTDEGVTGEFGTSLPSDPLPEFGGDLVPTPGDSELQFSSDTNGNPEALLAQTQASIKAHAEMNACYGLTQPIATLGSHPWLRDELATPGTSEPANAIPNQVRGVPMQRTSPNN
jgi:hypothetical protein